LRAEMTADAKSEIKELSSIQRELSIVIPKEEIQKETDHAYKRLSQRVKLNGFRPGKAPRRLLEQHYQNDVTKEVFDKLMQKSLQSAVLSHEIKPISTPKIESKAKFEGSSDFPFTATFEIKPKIAIKKYKGLKFESPSYTIGDNDLNFELERLQKQEGTLIAIEGRDSIIKGDFVQCKYSIVPEGDEEKEPRASEAITFEIGKNSFFEEAETALVGKKAGDHLAVEVTVPNSHPKESMRRKKAKLSIDIDAIKIMKLPALDDEFAKDLSEKFETLEDVKGSILNHLNESKKTRDFRAKKDAATKALIKANPMEVPSAMIEGQAEQMAMGALSNFPVKQAKELWAKMGETLKEQAMPQATTIVQAALLCEAIISAEKIVIGEQEIEAELAAEAKRMNVELSALKSRYSKEDIQNMHMRLAADRAIMLVIENSDISILEKPLIEINK